MRKANWIAGAAVVFVILAIALTFDPLGFFEGGADDPSESGYSDDPLTSGGLKGRGSRALPDADPKEWQGEPVGRLVLRLGKATLKGQVTGQGQPLRFARVRPALPPPHDRFAVRTRKDGTWEIAGMPDGQHEVRASAEDYVGKTVIAPQVAGEQTAEVETIDLMPRPENASSIVVRVTDFLGRPIPHAKVLATTMPWDLHLAMGPEMAGMPGVLHRSGTTDDSGKVRLGPLVAEDYGVCASAPGYVNAAVDRVIVTAGRTRSVGLRLTEAVSISGRITDGEGNPVAGAIVMGMSQPSFHSSLTVHSDADGMYVLDGLRKGAYMVIGYEDKFGQIMTRGNAPGVMDLKLGGTGRVKGKAVWEDGSPVKSGHVRPFQSGPFQYVYSAVEPVMADGTFDINLPPGEWNLRLQSGEGFMSDGTVVTVTVGQTTTVTIKVPKTGVVRGVVMDEQGNHIADAEVYVMKGGFPETPSREQYARTDGDGRFEVQGLTFETVDLHVEHSSYQDTKIRVTPAPAEKAKEESVRLKAGASVTGRVTDAEGTGIAGEQVNLALSWFSARSTHTDTDGAYRFDAVTPGKYTMTTGPYEMGARGLRKSDVQVPDAGTITVNFENPVAEGKVTGLVTQAGAPVPGATIKLTDARGAEKAVAARTDEEGKFTAGGLQYGRVHVVATAPGGMTGERRVAVAEGAEPTVVNIEIGSATVRARILDSDGEPAPGCWINVEVAGAEDGNWSRVKDNGNSNSEGVFESKGILPGTFILRVNRTEFAQYVSAPFALAEGERKDLGDIRMTRGVLLNGVVKDDAGAPVEKATISLKDMQGRPVFLFSMATTGSDGRYSLHSIEPGRYTVHFEAMGHAPDEKTVEINETGASADAILTRGGGVSVAVEDQSGAPISGVRVRLYDDKGRLVTKTISMANFDSGRRFTGADGTTALNDLASGTYVVKCEKAGYTTVGNDPRCRVEPGGTATVRVVIEASP